VRKLTFLLLAACSSGGGGRDHSLDGFLGNVDLASPSGDLASSDLAAVDLATSDLASTDLASIAGSGLDPLLSPADGNGQSCTTPGSLAECPGYAVCRWYTSTELRCDAADQSNPGIGALCNQSEDCDLMYACYRGFCFNFCTLGGTDCGFPDDCVDVGYAASNIGVCKN
jgi:hypothetical protein